MKFWSGRDEDKLTSADLNDGLSAYPGPRRGGYHDIQSSYPRVRDEEQKASQDQSWRAQLKLVIFLTLSGPVRAAADTTDEEEQPPLTMSHDEADAIWQSMDNYRYGYVSSSLIQRWLANEANFNLPFEEEHFLYPCFNTKETQGRITEAQFKSVLAGP